MAVPKRIVEAKGSWTGASRLNLPWLPPEERVSESTSRLRVDVHDAYAMIAYTWEHEGEGQEGSMLVCRAEESNAVQIGWVDSWHQNSGVMHLVGSEAEAGAVETRGSFLAGEETWGWTFALDLAEDTLTLTMENVTPAGEAEWAVRASYRRD